MTAIVFTVAMRLGLVGVPCLADLETRLCDLRFGCCKAGSLKGNLHKLQKKMHFKG